MKILALDSSALTATVALCDDAHLLGEYSVNNGNTHSENLLPMIEHLLRISKTEIRDIDVFACTNGPGSFTGVRIGVSTVKGLAFGQNKPCIGVSTLEALAHNLNGFDGLVVPAMNARRRQVYTGLFRSEEGTLTRLTPDMAIAAQDLIPLILNNRRQGEKLFVCGDGYDLVMAAASELHPTPVQERLRWQSAYQVALCALDAYRTGVRTKDNELAPVYLRPSQAERERKEKAEHNTEEA